MQGMHPIQYIIASLSRTILVTHRIIGRGGFGQTREHRQLRQIQFIQRTTVVSLRRRGKAIRAVTQKYFINIQLQNLRLAEVFFQLKRHQHFLELSLVGFFVAQKEISRHLHGDGARALATPARFHITQYRAQYGFVIHPRMAVKIIILGGDNRVQQDRWRILDKHRNTPFIAVFSNQQAIAGKNAQRHV